MIIIACGVRINRVVDVHEFVKRHGNPGIIWRKTINHGQTRRAKTERTSRETFRDLILYLILSAKSREFVLLKATSSPSRILFLLSRRPFVPEQRRFLEWSTRYIFIRLVLSFLKLSEKARRRCGKKVLRKNLRSFLRLIFDFVWFFFLVC